MSGPEQEKDQPQTTPEQTTPYKKKGEVSIREGAELDAEQVRRDRERTEKGESEQGAS